LTGASTDPAISVVVCDDVSEMRKLLRYTLETDPGMQVVGEAENGREGARVIAELQPDVVLLDLSMPDMDGLETLPAISSAAPDTGIIILSGFAADRMREPALRGGADLYLEKGLPLDEVISAVRDVASARRDDHPDDAPPGGGRRVAPPGGFVAAWLKRVGPALRPGVAAAIPIRLAF